MRSYCDAADTCQAKACSQRCQRGPGKPRQQRHEFREGDHPGYRNLATGDFVNVYVYVSGSTAYATLSISANTAAAIVQGQMGTSYGYGYRTSGTAQICGMYINESIFASPISGSGYTGTMGGGTIALWGPSSWITSGGQYILF